MIDEKTRLSRRNFLLAAGAGGAASAAAAAALATGNSRPEAVVAALAGPDTDATRAATDSAHARNYYRTARI